MRPNPLAIQIRSQQSVPKPTTQQSRPKSTQQSGQAVAQYHQDSFVPYQPPKGGVAFDAAARGSLEEVKALLDNVLAKPKLAQELMREGPDWNGPLEIAAKNGHTKVVDLLLDAWLQHKSLRPHIIQRPGEALGKAAEHGQLDVAKVMLDKIRQAPELLTFMHRTIGNSPLTKAIENRHYDVVSLFLEFAEKNPQFENWALQGAGYALQKATSNFDDKMVGLLMSTKNWERFVKGANEYHPDIQTRINEAIAPYLVDL